MLSLLALMNFVFGSRKNVTTPNNSFDNSMTNNSADIANSTRIGKGTEIEGEITATGAMRIEGTVKGTINCKSRVIIGVTGFVDGDIVCEHIEVHGKIQGNVNVKDTITLKSTAHFEGNVNYNKLLVDSGAIFNGNMQQHSTKSAKKLVPNPANLLGEQAKAV